jgi:hypothetical protein
VSIGAVLAVVVAATSLLGQRWSSPGGLRLPGAEEAEPYRDGKAERVREGAAAGQRPCSRWTRPSIPCCGGGRRRRLAPDVDLRIPRRTFLAASGTLAAGLWLPTVRGGPAAADALHRRAQAVAAGARAAQPTATIAAATDLLALTEVAALAPGTARWSLHRTAALAALTAALAAQRAQRPARGYLARARDHADAASDGPLRAQALVLQRDDDGAATHLVNAGNQASVKLLRAALDAAGAGRDTAGLRAAVLYRLAWERAALGDRHGALQELDGADVSAALAVPAPDMVEDGDLRGGGAAARRGKALRRAGCPTAAETALAEALAARLHPSGALVDLARIRAAGGDVDGAVAALEEAYLTARTAGSRRSEAKVRHIAATLPDSAATRSLADLIRA